MYCRTGAEFRMLKTHIHPFVVHTLESRSRSNVYVHSLWAPPCATTKKMQCSLASYRRR